MKQTNNEIFREAIETFGEDNQLFQLCEEMSELIKAVNKWRRNKELAVKYPAYVEDVAEEIADVEIMIEQLQMILEIPHNEIYDIRIKKIERLKQRVKERKEHES
jgi:NTP pyrophosphatase (non-canonical NTP hydrolase)